MHTLKAHVLKYYLVDYFVVDYFEYICTQKAEYLAS